MNDQRKTDRSGLVPCMYSLNKFTNLDTHILQVRVFTRASTHKHRLVLLCRGLRENLNIPTFRINFSIKSALEDSLQIVPAFVYIRSIL